MLSLLVLHCSNFLFLDAFMLISILIDCSFHSCCPCLHCFSHHYSVACSASIVVVVPEFGYQALESKLPFDSCYRPSRDFRLAPPFPLIVRKGTERGSAVRSVRTSRGFAVLDLLLPLCEVSVAATCFLCRVSCCSILTAWVTQYAATNLPRTFGSSNSDRIARQQSC